MANKQKKPVTQEEQTQRHIRSAEELRKGAPIINAMVAAVAWTSSASKEVEGLIHGISNSSCVESEASGSL
jgi:alpha-galactosidase/6-phospho-beta-glucosidase family protein